MYMHITEYQLQGIDNFLDLTGTARTSEQRSLEQLQEQAAENVPEDWLVDDFVQLEDFSRLSTEFAIVGLWRCVELYRRRAMLFALGDHAAKAVFKHKQFIKKLASLGIDEAQIRCSLSVNELRCLNNSIKHTGRVDSELAQCHYWMCKNGAALDNLGPHYQRLRPLAENYMKDLSRRLDLIWRRNHA